MLERLRYAVRRAFIETEYYHDLLTGIGFDPFADFGFGEFAQIPPLNRDDVQRAGARLYSREVPELEVRRDATGGSTGQPTEIQTGPEERGWRESGTEFYMRRIGVPRGSSIGLLWGHHLDPVASDRLADRLRAFAESIRWYDCLRLSPDRLREYHIDLQRWQPSCIVAYASALGALAEEVDRIGGPPPAYPLRCFVTGAEKLMPYQRERVERVFQRSVHERYGSRDVGLMGFQTRSAEGSLEYEVDWANVLIEPESSDPESAILVTKLHADGMPMLRYRVGDVGRFPRDSRPGEPTLRLSEVIGRDTDRIWLPGGRWLHGNIFPHLIKDHPVREFQVAQAGDYSVIVRLVPSDSFTEESRQAIAGMLRENLAGVPVSVECVEAIQRTRANKWRPVVTEVGSRGPGVSA